MYKKPKKLNRYERNRRHIKEVKRRMQRRERERVKQALLERKRILIPVGSVLILLLFFLIGTAVVRGVGKSRLQENVNAASPSLQGAVGEENLTQEEEAVWKDGWIKYQGEIYEYKEDVITFLIMGIDKNSDVKKVAEGTDGGQADALFLAVLDTADQMIRVIGINRNTMTDIDIYDENGAYVSTTKAQIAVQHGFGDGMEESCEYQKTAVQKLFYDLPIHGYAAINMSAIETINDAVGGVDVTVLEDLTKIDESLVEGKQIHLLGKSAFWYVKYRDTDIFGSADMRLARQKQYLNNFIRAAKQAAKKDLTTILNLYQAIMPQTVTDVSPDEAAYIAPMLVDYRFDENSFYSMEGETVRGERFEEFYPDEDALVEMIVGVFYQKVDLQD